MNSRTPLGTNTNNYPLKNIFSKLEASNYQLLNNKKYTISQEENQERINNFVSQWAQRPIIATPKKMHDIRRHYTLAANSSIPASILTCSFLPEITNLKEFTAAMVDRSLWSKLMIAEVQEAAAFTYDIAIIAQCIQFELEQKDIDIKNPIKPLVARFLQSNILSDNNAHDAHYLENVPTIDSELEKYIDFSGQNGGRYQGGVYGEAKIALKFAEAKYHPVIEVFSINLATHLGLHTGNPKLIKVQQQNGTYALGMKSTFIKGLETIVSFDIAKRVNNFKNPEIAAAGKAEATAVLRDYTSTETNLIHLAIYLLHMVLTKNIDGFGRNFGNLQCDENNNLVLLDAGYSMWFKGLGQQKDLSLDKGLSKDVVEDIAIFNNPKLHLPICIVIEVVREKLHENPELKAKFIAIISDNLTILDTSLEQIATHSKMDTELASHSVEVIRARINSLHNNLDILFNKD